MNNILGITRTQYNYETLKVRIANENSVRDIDLYLDKFDSNKLSSGGIITKSKAK